MFFFLTLNPQIFCKFANDCAALHVSRGVGFTRQYLENAADVYCILRGSGLSINRC